jgi:poly(ribitol-phosphate) beta-N-acetylglucosaminyltransferase
VSSPVVSVVVPVWNVERFLRQCLDSVIGQSIGLDRVEVVAVDDGSTDSSGAILDEYAARFPQVKAIHEPNSGGPGRPRNVGIDHASGTYVFFLDADDYLGREALERMVAMAERNSSDVVLGKMVGVDGRMVPERPFRRNLDRASLAQVYSTLSVLKLFRRALIERVGLRFAEGLRGGEDGPFTAQAYLEARAVSVVADYDCYYYRLRAGSQTKSGAQDDLLAYLERTRGRIELLARYREPGPERDRLMSRHIWDVLRPFYRPWLRLEPTERRRVFDLAAELIREWHTDRIQVNLPPGQALRAHCLQHGLAAELEDIVGCPARKAFGRPIVEDGRVFARYPHFRDAAGIPDRYFEVTRRIGLKQHLTRVAVVDSALEVAGEAYLTYLGGPTTIVLRRWPWGPELHFPTEIVPTPHLRNRDVDYRKAGFTGRVALDPHAEPSLSRGTWQLYLEVGPEQVRRRAPVQAPKDLASPPGPPSTGTALSVSGRGRVRLRVGPVDPVVRGLESGEVLLHRVGRKGQRWLRRAAGRVASPVGK